MTDPPASTAPRLQPFGDPDAEVCVDDACLLPAVDDGRPPQPPRPSVATRIRRRASPP